MDLGLIDKGRLFRKFFHINNLINREALWQYFLPTLFEDSAVTPEPIVGQTRIFKTVRFKLWLECPTILDVYFMTKMVRFYFLFENKFTFSSIHRNSINFILNYQFKVHISKHHFHLLLIPMVSILIYR
jgi:hypothetical protein